HALAAQDSGLLVDGGWMFPLGQEESLRPLAATYRQIPRVPFNNLPGDAGGDSQPVTARTARFNGNTWFYAVNDSAWNVTLRLQSDVPPDAKMDELSGTRRIAPPVGGLWSIELEPFDLLAV